MSSSQYPSPIFHSVNPTFLQPHPSYLSIYGEEENVSDVINLISNQQYPRPLLINQNNTIINGHLYCKAALSLGWNSIPVEIREFPNPEAELEALLLENIARSKTNEQKVREALAWEQIETVKAKQRQQLGAISTNDKLGRDCEKTLQENFPGALKGQTRDKVAKFVGLGSGRNYSKAKKIVTKIDNLIESGNMESALNLRNILNQQSIDAAVKLLKNPNLQNTEKPATQKPSCWNCKHCSREFTEDKHTYYCYKFGLLSFLEKDCETRADDCPAWNYRLEKTTNSTTLDNPSYFTLMLPSHLKPLMEDTAKISGMSLIDWAGHHLLQAIELSKATTKITH
jgi:Zn finger protein HypA/HybF involved in hydrogenase expression